MRLRKNICVENDIATGICHSHDGAINVTGYAIASQDYCYIGNKKVIREGDIIQFNCGHTGIVHSTEEITSVLNIKVIVDQDPVGPGSGDIDAIIHSSQDYCSTI